MEYRAIFRRKEQKYLLTPEQYRAIREGISDRMTKDEFGEDLVANLYFDTPDFLLIRRSLEHPVYKEKLRLRGYGTVRADSKVFAELKKKYRSVVYKRRLGLPERDAMRLLLQKEDPAPTQIGREIGYCVRHYGLAPRVYLSYEREALFAKDDPAFRMTFDRNILWRTEELSLSAGSYGTPLLEAGQVLMELKAETGIPLWLVDCLTKNRIYKTSFSKYGRVYSALCAQKKGDTQR